MATASLLIWSIYPSWSKSLMRTVGLQPVNKIPRCEVLSDHSKATVLLRKIHSMAICTLLMASIRSSNFKLRSWRNLERDNSQRTLYTAVSNISDE